ncbi:aminotransferase class I/II-fold pyridoxal phosphate-dependent enzyme [Treponema sp. Marseille-Q4130]|uniref:aminotransferase class I/II-fold pyridoxal phosphate-dependent enzyme n=1 Tax=Treponema sp. Marseille-Q4130 TaxID=2766702 RepID=UPI001CA30A9D|nr:aminotransferase class I/II-fold pyridoxal phosphate-dependent enzyme [Treponema sp. Marseille-Q4130]
MDLNENPEGLPKGFISEVLQNATPEFVAQYPETLDFTQLLADYIGTDIEHICLTNGSSEGIRHIIEAYSSSNGRIVGVSPTYAMFEVYPKMYGRKFVPVHYTEDLQMPIENIIKELTSDTQLLILLNPNNPIGNTVVYFPSSSGVSSTNLKQRIYERYKKLQDEANNHFPNVLVIEGKD